ncbi:FAD-binding protein [Acidovorax sp. Root267]|uniref:siderophore-interacting protein n=1 Tax=Acidovorax sp. Root267 TaxID=1736505 RepID=UPI00070954C9|nr:siderophore-interacting protein [Acidovorax sp. Root267]KRD21725.1 FAD-binding protein [Acidovorax sp. Root267]
MNAPLPTATSRADAAHLAVERVRHPLQARHLQVVRRTAVSPGFVRLTLAGPELAGFVSAGFDDHLKLILPQPGQERPSLPSMQDGRPVFPDPRPVLRDYTPARHDAAAGELDIEVALHDAGPATDWAASAAVGQWVGVAGPRGSMVVPTGFDWHWLIGDESALPAIARRLAELPASTMAVVRIYLRNPADQRALASAAQLDVMWADSLPGAVDALVLPPGAGYIWAAGEHSDMAAVRRAVLAKPGVDAKRMRISAYWKRGAADHHEDLVSAAG